MNRPTMQGKLKGGQLFVGHKNPYPLINNGDPTVVDIIQTEEHSIYGTRFKVIGHVEWFESQCFEWVKDTEGNFIIQPPARIINEEEIKQAYIARNMNGEDIEKEILWMGVRMQALTPDKDSCFHMAESFVKMGVLLGLAEELK